MQKKMSNMRNIREQSGKKACDIAAQLGVSRVTLWAYETGARKIAFDKAVKLAKIYKCSVSDFVDEDQINEGETKARYSVD